MPPSGDPRVIPNDEIEPFVEDVVMWCRSQLTAGQRAIAAQTAMYQLQEAIELLSDLRAELVRDLMDESDLTQVKAAAVLGVSTDVLRKVLARGSKPRRTGGDVGNRANVNKRWARVRREWGQSAAQRRANGYPGGYARRDIGEGK